MDNELGRVGANPLRSPSDEVIKWCGVTTDIEERKRAEQALWTLENRYRLIVDGLPAIVTLLAIKLPSNDCPVSRPFVCGYNAAPGVHASPRH